MSKTCIVVNAPDDMPPALKSRTSIFLSGTIERDGTDWRKHLITELADLPVVALNPHRSDWDKSWREDIDFEPFRKQVIWELDNIEEASLIAVYFAKATDAPISLLELGLRTKSPDKVVVCCPTGYPKKGNVQILCQKYSITFTENFEEFVKAIRGKVQSVVDEV